GLLEDLVLLKRSYFLPSFLFDNCKICLYLETFLILFFPHHFHYAISVFIIIHNEFNIIFFHYFFSFIFYFVIFFFKFFFILIILFIHSINFLIISILLYISVF